MMFGVIVLRVMFCVECVWMKCEGSNHLHNYFQKLFQYMVTQTYYKIGNVDLCNEQFYV